MRIALGLLTVTLLILGAHTLAQGDDAGGDDLQSLKARVEALELETEYLRMREADLTAYILGHKQRSDLFKAAGAEARAQGYEKNRNPVPAREAFLRGSEAVWASMGTDLPEVTKSEAALLKRADAHRKLKQVSKAGSK